MRTPRRALALAIFVLLFFATVSIASPAQTLTSLASFTGGNGATPQAPLVQGADGSFYGTTSRGGTDNSGTIYKINPSGTLTTLFSFCYPLNCHSGAYPSAGLLLGADGAFYGTTQGGGGGYSGTVFKITTRGVHTTLYTFCSRANCADGWRPVGGLVQGSDGDLYGTTYYGGAHGSGSIFRMTTRGAMVWLYSFCSAPYCPDGKSPAATLIQGTDGNFYGTTQLGGGNGEGTAFKITPAGVLTTLYRFCSQPACADGVEPASAVVQAIDGNFYGTTSWVPETNQLGTVFKMTPQGTITWQYHFSGPDGVGPQGLMQASDGNLYGTTSSYGAHTGGTIFKITPAGVLTTLYNFCSQSDCADGEGPSAALFQASDGNLYGTTEDGGTDDKGTVFSFTGPAPTATQFVPLTPCRLVDTRQTQTPIPGGTFQFFTLPQLGGCHIPATAAAYSLNVTVAPQGPLGYLTIWPAGRPQPTVSTLNSTDGRVKANAAIVPAGVNAAVSVYASDTTNVILDINGYFTTPGAGTLQFYTLPPCRIVDTRNNRHGGTLQAGVERDFTIPTNCGVPTSAQAYSFNITAIPPSGDLDYLTVWPKGQYRPVVSTLNDDTGTIVANAAIVPAGPYTATAFYPHNNRTDLLIDVNGYFAPPGTGGLSFYPTAPCRVFDTRHVGTGHPFHGVYNSPDGIDVLTSPCTPPSTSQAFVFNATVVPSGPMPYLTLWPHGEDQPNVSTLNATDGVITSNMAIVPTNDGSINAYADALTQLILDISGYFAP